MLKCKNIWVYKIRFNFEKNVFIFLSVCMILIYFIFFFVVNVMGMYVGVGENFKLVDFLENN